MPTSLRARLHLILTTSILLTVTLAGSLAHAGGAASGTLKIGSMFGLEEGSAAQWYGIQGRIQRINPTLCNSVHLPNANDGIDSVLIEVGTANQASVTADTLGALPGVPGVVNSPDLDLYAFGQSCQFVGAAASGETNETVIRCKRKIVSAGGGYEYQDISGCEEGASATAIKYVIIQLFFGGPNIQYTLSWS